MANRFWVGGTGTWSSTNTTNWSATSGGAGGASVPTATDDVFFNANSNIGVGSFTCTMANSPRLCQDITISGLDGVMTLAGGGTIRLEVSGSLSFPATNFTRSYTGQTTFNATTTGKTVTTNGKTFGGDVVFSGVGGEWTLGSSLTATGTRRITVTAGTFSTSATNYSITASAFLSSNTNTRVINLNGSTVTLSSTGTTLNTDITTNLTFNAGTSTINLTGAAGSILGGGVTFHDVAFTSISASSSSRIVSGANTFNNLSFGPLSAAFGSIDIRDSLTINDTLTITGSNGTQRFYVFSNVSRTVRILTCNAVSLTDVDFEDIEITGTAAPASGTRLGDRTGNTGITFPAPKNCFWNLLAGGNWNANAWATSSGGAVANINFPLPQDTAIIENAGLNTGVQITLNANYGYSSIDASTRTNAWNLSISASRSFYGNFAINTAVSFFGSSNTLFFKNESIKTFDSGGKTFNFHNINLACPTAGGLQLVNSNLTFSIGGLVLTNGTLDLNNLTFSTVSFSSGAGTLSRNITFNGGTLSVEATPFTGGATNFTTTAGAGTGVISMPRATAKTFNGNGATYNCSLNQGGAGTLTITGSNTFDDITNSVQPATILFTAGTTQTVNNFSLSGTSGNLITIDSTTGAQFTLSKASGTVSTSFLDIRDSVGTGGAAWNAFTSNGNVDGGNNTGWIFSGAPPLDVFVSGVAGTGDVGIVSVEEGTDVSVSGVASTGDVGTVSIQGTADIVVSGVAGTGDVGIVSVEEGTDVSVSGVVSTGNVGVVSIQGTADIVVSGVASTGDVGIVSVEEGTDVSVSGVASTGDVGTVSIQGTADIVVSGVASTGDVGTVSIQGTANIVVSGVAGTGDVGIVSVEEGVGVLVSGVASTGDVGIVTLFSGGIVFLVGVQALCLVGNTTVWGPVDDSDSANWVPVNDSNGAPWTPVNDSNGTSWTSVPN